MPFSFFYLFDPTYIYIVLPCILLSIWASASVNSTFKRYSKQMSSRRITGREAALWVLEANGVTNVHVERISGKLTDHFDPKSNVIRLSDDVYNSTSTAAIGVACHEAGHAVQYARSYFPMRVRAVIIPATNIGSWLSMPLILIGVLFGIGGEYSYGFIYAGIICFSLSLVFQLVTLPVEFNASRRAMQAIVNRGILTKEEQEGARKTLTAAAMTYVAAVAVSAAQLLRLVLLFGGRRDD